MKYISTRDAANATDAAGAILQGLAPDGGLYVPAADGVLDIEALQGQDYCQIALQVLRGFLAGYDEDFLRSALRQSYGENFGGKAGALVQLSEGLFSMELWHGPTAAFKDYALQLMPKLLVEARHMKRQTGRTLVLVATSGDTGKAALEGFKDVDGVAIAAFYPDHGTSEIQRLQMVTQTGNNVAVYAVRGNFDDAQRGVKAAFVDTALAERLKARNERLSSANSINWGRLVPQIVYYVSAYLGVCTSGAARLGETVDFCVPTGNFGDIMAGYYAKRMGLPVGKLICASNKNNVLTEFLNTGRYDANRDFFKTSSPSMDILVSSNLERLLYHASGSDARVRGWMQQLKENGSYQVDSDTLAVIRQSFAAGWADETAVGEEIAWVFTQYKYLCDPHTAVAFNVWRAQQAQRPTVVLSTASPFKFSGKVLEALGQPVPADEFEGLRALERFAGTQAPKSLADLNEKQVRFTEVIDAESIINIPEQL